jgi:hypothetical protein
MTVTAFYFPLVFWTLRGMEVGLQTLLIDLALLLIIQSSKDQAMGRAILISLMFLLAILGRIDAVLQVVILAIYLAVRNKFDVRVIALPFATIVITTLAIFWFQHTYFGDYLPNTYYQKVTGFSVWERVRNGLLAFNQHATRDTLFLIVFSLLGLLLYKDVQNREVLLMAGLFAVQCAYSVFVGGDYAEVEVGAANRFITQGMPALIILFSIVADRVITDLIMSRRPGILSRPLTQSVIAVGVGFGVLFVISGTVWMNWGISNAPLWKADVRRVKLGLAIAEYTSPDVTIAVHAAGQIPYYSERRTIDLLGLNDAVIAKGPPASPFYPGHDKWNYNYSILQLKPDLIVDNFQPLAGFMRNVKEYQKLESGIYIRKDSTLINVDGLSQEYR